MQARVIWIRLTQPLLSPRRTPPMVFLFCNASSFNSVVSSWRSFAPCVCEGSLFISSTLSSTNPTCKFQQKGFIRSNIEIFLCIYWHFILFPNALCFEIGKKLDSSNYTKKWNMFFHRISSKNVVHTENINRSTFKVKVFSGSNTDKLFVDRKTCCITKKTVISWTFSCKNNWSRLMSFPFDWRVLHRCPQYWLGGSLDW